MTVSMICPTLSLFNAFIVTATLEMFLFTSHRDSVLHTMLNTLPFETIDHIIQFLEDDQYSLLQLNALCILLHKITLPYLYHTPLIRDDESFLLFQSHMTIERGIYVKKLSLDRVPLRWTEGINSLLGTLLPLMPYIESLGLFGCCTLRNRTMINILRSLPLLKTISLQACVLLNDETIEVLVGSCPYVEALFLSGTCITDRSLELISEHLPSIKLLHMEDCENITEYGVDLLIQKCKQLKSVTIENCYNVVGDYSSVFNQLKDPHEFNTLSEDEWEDVESSEEWK